LYPVMYLKRPELKADISFLTLVSYLRAEVDIQSYSDIALKDTAVNPTRVRIYP